MPRKFQKRYRRKKRVGFRKRRYIRRIPRNRLTNRMYAFKRTFEAASLVVLTGNIAQAVYSLSLSNLPDFTDFTNLFDMYKIAGIKFNFVPVYNMANNTLTNKFEFFSVVDYNDLNTITQAEAMQYQNLKKTTCTITHKRYMRPRVALEQSDVSSTAFVASYKPMWISTLNTNIAHGFLKVVTDTNSGTLDFTFRIYITLYMLFKNVN